MTYVLLSCVADGRRLMEHDVARNDSSQLESDKSVGHNSHGSGDNKC